MILLSTIKEYIFTDIFLFMNDKDALYVEIWLLVAASVLALGLYFNSLDDNSSSKEAIEDQRELDESRMRAKKNRHDYVD